MLLCILGLGYEIFMYTWHCISSVAQLHLHVIVSPVAWTAHISAVLIAVIATVSAARIIFKRKITFYLLFLDNRHALNLHYSTRDSCGRREGKEISKADIHRWIQHAVRSSGAQGGPACFISSICNILTRKIHKYFVTYIDKINKNSKNRFICLVTVDCIFSKIK
jgi:hypothetical protein